MAGKKPPLGSDEKPEKGYLELIAEGKTKKKKKIRRKRKKGKG